MAKAVARIVAIAVAAVLLAACTDAATLLAGSAKGFCSHSGTSPCTRPPPGYSPTTPPR